MSTASPRVEGPRPFGEPSVLAENADYTIVWPGADRLRIGSRELRAQVAGIFPFRFESQTGLATLRGYAGARPLPGALDVEVVSTKLGDLDEYRRFFRALSQDLFARACRYVLRIEAAPTGHATSRGGMPNVLFALHFFLERGQEIADALRTITERPHVGLDETEERVDLGQVRDLDADLLRELCAPRGRTARTAHPALARVLPQVPAEVWSRLARETTDTPENRFALWLLEHLRASLDSVLAHPAAIGIPADRREQLAALGAELGRLADHPSFDEVGAMRRLPVESRVLTRREGYRALFPLLDVHEEGRGLLFETAARAIELREVWRLYEVWVFFALIDRISEVLEAPAMIREPGSGGTSGLSEGTVARWEGGGELVYNRHRAGYSVRMKPDYLWIASDGTKVAFDAKYRTGSVGVERRNEDDAEHEARELGIDPDSLHAMHAYRDALSLPAAIAIYPGSGSAFWHAGGGRRAPLPDFATLIRGEHQGIGAWALRPDLTGEREGERR